MQNDKIDYIVEQIGGINKTLEFQSKQLEDHIRRTAMLEERVRPIEDHVKFIQGMIKLIAFLSTSGGTLAVILKVLGKL